MIEINYVVTDDFEEISKMNALEFDSNGDLNGFFEIVIGDFKYGDINHKLIDNGFSGSELIGSWFERLFETFRLLFSQDRVFLNDIESAQSMIMFEKKSSQMITISEVNCDKFDGCQYTELYIDSYKIIRESKSIMLVDLIYETINKMDDFIQNLLNTNSIIIESKRVQRLLSMCREVKEQVEIMN